MGGAKEKKVEDFIAWLQEHDIYFIQCSAWHIKIYKNFVLQYMVWPSTDKWQDMTAPEGEQMRVGVPLLMKTLVPEEEALDESREGETIENVGDDQIEGRPF